MATHAGASPDRDPVDARARTLGWVTAGGTTVLTALVVLLEASTARAGGVAYAEHVLSVPLLGLVIVLLTAGALAVAAVAPRRPWTAVGLGVVQVAAVLPLAAAWAELPDRVGAALVSLFPLAPWGMLLAGLGWTTALHLLARPVVLVGGLALAGTAAMLLAYDPFRDLGCARTCSEVPAPLAGVLSARGAVWVGVVTCTVAAGATVLVLRLDRRARATAVTAGAVATLVAVAVLAITRGVGWGHPTATGWVTVLQSLAPVPLACGVLATLAAERRRRRDLEGVVAALSAAEPLAPRGHGPVLAADFARHDGLGWVDVAGDAVTDAPSGPITVLADDRGPVVRLRLRPGARAAQVVEALTPATLLALRNAQLSASLREQLREVQASQRRAVTVSDAEQARIERDLHDGAQQRLVGVAFHLRLARGRADADRSARLTAAEVRVLGVLGHLRRFSHGSVPSVLADEGLVAALAELTGESRVPCQTEAEVTGPVGSAGELAVFHAVAAVLAAVSPPGPATSATVRVASTTEGLRLDVRVVGVQRAIDEETWVDVADRVGALGGRWRLSGDPGRVELEAVVPCE